MASSNNSNPPAPTGTPLSEMQMSSLKLSISNPQGLVFPFIPSGTAANIVALFPPVRQNSPFVLGIELPSTAASNDEGLELKIFVDGQRRWHIVWFPPVGGSSRLPPIRLAHRYDAATGGFANEEEELCFGKSFVRIVARAVRISNGEIAQKWKAAGWVFRSAETTNKRRREHTGTGSDTDDEDTDDEDDEEEREARQSAVIRRQLDLHKRQRLENALAQGQARGTGREQQAAGGESTNRREVVQQPTPSLTPPERGEPVTKKARRGEQENAARGPATVSPPTTRAAFQASSDEEDDGADMVTLGARQRQVNQQDRKRKRDDYETAQPTSAQRDQPERENPEQETRRDRLADLAARRERKYAPKPRGNGNAAPRPAFSISALVDSIANGTSQTVNTSTGNAAPRPAPPPPSQQRTPGSRPAAPAQPRRQISGPRVTPGPTQETVAARSSPLSRGAPGPRRPPASRLSPPGPASTTPTRPGSLRSASMGTPTTVRRTSSTYPPTLVGDLQHWLFTATEEPKAADWTVLGDILTSIGESYKMHKLSQEQQQELGFMLACITYTGVFRRKSADAALLMKKLGARLMDREAARLEMERRVRREAEKGGRLNWIFGIMGRMVRAG